MPGAVLLRLYGGTDVGGDLTEMRGDLLARVADHDDQMLGLQFACGGEDMTHETATAELVQDLGCGRLHTGALTRCENDDGCRAVGAHGMPFGCGWGGVTSAGYRGVLWGAWVRVPTGSLSVRTRT
ncbi:hypothetical protein GCM10010234_63170 [Streptomyces hawaiiensis]